MNIINFQPNTNLGSRIIELESKMNFQLPSDYFKFITSTNGGLTDNVNNFFCKDQIKIVGDIPYKLEALFGFLNEGDENYESYNIEKVNAKFKNQLPIDVLLVGKLVNDGYLAITLSNPKDYVYVWDTKFLKNLTMEVKLNESKYPHIKDDQNLHERGVVLNSFAFVSTDISKFIYSLYANF